MDVGSLQDRYKSEQVFLIGNGPSLANTPLNWLEDEYTFALNNINPIYQTTDWRPDFYLYRQERTGLESEVKENIRMGAKCFLDKKFERKFGTASNICYISIKSLLGKKNKFHKTSFEKFQELSLEDYYQFWSDNPRKQLYAYHSTYIIFQLLAYMGFSKIYLIGCDLGYGKHDPHMIFDTGIDPLDYGDPNSRLGAEIEFLKDSWEDKFLVKSFLNGVAYQLLRSPANSKIRNFFPDDKDHFIEDYWKQPKDQRHINIEQKKAHISARTICLDKNVEIFNATIGGELEIHPRVNLEDIVGV